MTKYRCKVSTPFGTKGEVLAGPYLPCLYLKDSPVCVNVNEWPDMFEEIEECEHEWTPVNTISSCAPYCLKCGQVTYVLSPDKPLKIVIKNAAIKWGGDGSLKTSFDANGIMVAKNMNCDIEGELWIVSEIKALEKVKE